MPLHEDDQRGELTLDYAGRLLYDAERAILARATDGGDDWTETLIGADADGPPITRGAILALALDALGKLRGRAMAEAAEPAPEPTPEPDADTLAPVDVLRTRIRAGLEDATSNLIHDPRFDLGDAHALKALAGAYVALGGDLELEAKVSGAEYARLVSDTADTIRRLNALRDSARAVLAATVPTGVRLILNEGEALADFRAALEDLDAALLA